MFKIVKVNSHKVEPIVTTKINPDDILGGEIAPVPYCNVFLVAETQSGKTSALRHLIKHCAGNAMVVAFVPTIDSDQSWNKIKEDLAKNGNKFVGFSNLEETIKDKNGKSQSIDRLKELLDHFMKYPMNEHPKCNGKVCPRLIVVMDDMSRYLKHPSVAEFLKNGRHAKAKFIISTQNIHSVLPEDLRQMRQWFIFKGMPDSKIKKIRDDSGIDLSFEKLWEIYKAATKEPYSFLLINKNGSDFEFYRNFSDKIIVEEEKI